ncbi:hypothetical protein BDFB_003493 [Asbolus verrucosus]|uniref:Uncharacterized protein n=1 Tax=Asbolus verrucosus TaxID=1661398 RepID=A0A482VQ91_ASBVE|nr:hypothetical protein BDFB_003493 [Asbolus verrucosus]
MLTVRVLPVVLLLVFAMDSARCRSFDKNYYHVSTTTNGDDVDAEELVIFTQNELIKVKHAEVKPTSKTKEKSRCVGPATLMAMCF